MGNEEGRLLSPREAEEERDRGRRLQYDFFGGSRRAEFSNWDRLMMLERSGLLTGEDREAIGDMVLGGRWSHIIERIRKCPECSERLRKALDMEKRRDNAAASVGEQGSHS